MMAGAGFKIAVILLMIGIVIEVGQVERAIDRVAARVAAANGQLSQIMDAAR